MTGEPIIILSKISGHYEILWSILALVFVIYVSSVFILLYHWRRYGMGSRLILMAESFYLIVSAALFLSALFVLVAIQI